MSALDQKQTCAPQKAMSALPLIATAKANSRKRSCLLYPRKRTCAVQLQMSAKGHKRTYTKLACHYSITSSRNNRGWCETFDSLTRREGRARPPDKMR
jgi:hypothetical protein